VFTLVGFLNILISLKNFDYFFLGQGSALILTIMFWATFWAMFFYKIIRSPCLRTCDNWVKTIRLLVSATKNVEVQKEHENFLRKQFQAADPRGAGRNLFLR
jgi:hypothetical protein